LSERGKKKKKKTKGEKRRDLSLVDDDDRLAAALKSSPLSLSPPRQQEHNILPMARAGAEEEKLQQSQQKDPRARESESTAWISLASLAGKMPLPLLISLSPNPQPHYSPARSGPGGRPWARPCPGRRRPRRWRRNRAGGRQRGRRVFWRRAR
jgi:hypothetical protein